MVKVNFGKMLTACSMPPRGEPIEAFVHRATGDVLFVAENDEAAAQHFGIVAGNLTNLRAAVAKSADWLAVPKHNGRVMDLKDFMLAWCEANGFTNEGENCPRTRFYVHASGPHERCVSAVTLRRAWRGYHQRWRSPMKPSLILVAALCFAGTAFAESRSVLVIVTHDKAGTTTVAIHSDDKQDRRDAATIEEACKALSGMKGWGSTVSVSVVTGNRMARKDRKALFDAIDSNVWLDLSYYGPDAPKNLAEHFLKAEETGEWQAAEVTAFTDFDDLRVKIGGKEYRAFLVGLQPLGNKAEMVRKDLLARLQKNALSVRVVTTNGDSVGLSMDAFSHHKNDFGHDWDPGKYPYCWSGWGAYNFNAYFLHAGLTKFSDNFGRNDRYRKQFAEVVKTLTAPEPPKATRVLEGSKTTFPAKSMAEGVKLLIGVLESCHDISDESVKYSAEDLKNAQKEDHVRFVFPKAIKCEVLEKKLEVSEAIYAKGVFWLVCGKDVVRCTKYTFDKMEPFRKWFEQTLPAD